VCLECGAPLIAVRKLLIMPIYHVPRVKNTPIGDGKPLENLGCVARGIANFRLGFGKGKSASKIRVKRINWSQIWLENSLNKNGMCMGVVATLSGVMKKIKVTVNKGNTGKIPPDLKLKTPYNLGSGS
jgi:hypothetical protein